MSSAAVGVLLADLIGLGTVLTIPPAPLYHHMPRWAATVDATRISGHAQLAPKVTAPLNLWRF